MTIEQIDNGFLITATVKDSMLTLYASDIDGVMKSTRQILSLPDAGANGGDPWLEMRSAGGV